MSALARPPAGFRERPYDAQAEQLLLGAILGVREKWNALHGRIALDHLYDHRHQQILAAIQNSTNGSGRVVLQTIKTALANESWGELDPACYIQQLAELGAVSAQDDVDLDGILGHLVDLAGRRAWIEFAEQIGNAAYEATAAECAASARQFLEGLRAQAGATDGATALRAISAGELTTLALPPRESVLGPWFSEKGLTMIYGSRGEGKTYLTLAAAIAIASGGQFLCWDAPKPRRVLLIDGEMPAEAMQQRVAGLMRSAGLDRLETLRILTPDLQNCPMPNIASEQGQAELAPLINHADVVILDNLASLCRSGDENDRQPWLVTQGWLLRLRSEGKSALIVHHAGKGGDQRGTSAREDVLDTVIKLKRPADHAPEQGLRAEWHFTKHRGFCGDDALPIEVQLTTGPDGAPLWTWRPLENALVLQVADALNDGMSLRDIAGDMGISKSQAHRLKKKAEATGLVKTKMRDS